MSTAASTAARTTSPRASGRVSAEGRRRDLTPTLAFPLWAYLVFFYFTPFVLIIWYSFGRKPDIFTAHSNKVLSLGRYHEALGSTFITTFWNTLRIASLGTALCLLIALPFAYWMAVKVDPKWRGLMIALVLVPFWTNFLVRTIGWRIILAPHGFAGRLLNDLHLHSGPISILDTRTAVQVGVVYNYLPLMILPLYVALERSDQSLREAARDLGAGRIKTLFSVTLPMAAPGIAAGCLLVFIPLMGDYITATVLGGAKGNMVGQLVANQFETAQNWALGSAMAMVLILFILTTVAIIGVLFLITRAVIRRSRRVELSGGAA